MLPYSTQLIENDDIDAIKKALNNPLLTQGKITQDFEEALCDYCNARFAIAFNSATSALYAAYNAYNLQDSEVITTPISFVATSNMLLQNNAKPVFCDIQTDGNIDCAKIPPLITSKTKAIVSVDYGGKSVDIESIKAIAKKHHLIFISDSSHAIGTKYQQSPIGSLADATIFSFHPVKPITTLEGGALLTNDEEIYQKAKLIVSHGILKKELWHSDMLCNGFNFRMNEIQAALGITQLKKLQRFIAIREEIACFYDTFFADNPYFQTLHQTNTHLSSNHLYPILLHPHLLPLKEKIFANLQQAGLGVQVHYKPIYQFSYYKQQFGEIHLPQAQNFYEAEISIPCHQKMNLQTAKEVAQTIIKVFEHL